MQTNPTLVLLGSAAFAVAWFGEAIASPDGEAEDNVIHVPAVIRDFRGYDPERAQGSHPDFENWDLRCCIISTGLVEEQLDAEGKPAYRSSYGTAIAEDWTTEDGQPINPAHFDPAAGDEAGEWHSNNSQPRIVDAESFSNWYRDVQGVNMSTVVMLRLQRDDLTGHWVFDSDDDPTYEPLGGFFPIDGLLFGNYENSGHNYHFTTEVAVDFTYKQDDEQVFTFTGDDDVWVFVNGKLVLDLGGRHSRREQVLFLNRLGWLVDGKTYEMKIFHAERKTTQSNFRIETNFELIPQQQEDIAAIFD